MRSGFVRRSRALCYALLLATLATGLMPSPAAAMDDRPLHGAATATSKGLVPIQYVPSPESCGSCRRFCYNLYIRPCSTRDGRDYCSAANFKRCVAFRCWLVCRGL